MKLLFLSFLVFSVASCKVKPPEIIVTGDPNLRASVSQQTSPEGVVGEELTASITVSYRTTESNLPHGPYSFIVSAFTDSSCTTSASGTLSFISATSKGLLSLSKIRYSKAEDIYIGITGTKTTKVCTNVVRFISSAPAFFTVETGAGQTVKILETLSAPVSVKILNADSLPVKNARVTVDGITSSASDSNGVATVTPAAGTLTGEIELAAILTYNGKIIHQVGVPLTVYSDIPSSIEIEYQDNPSITPVETPSNPIYLLVKDQYGNNIHPSLTSIAVSAHSDEACSSSELPIDAYDFIYNLAIDENDTSTWTTLSLYMFNNPGTLYLKYTVYNVQNTPVSSVCSEAITIVPQ